MIIKIRRLMVIALLIMLMFSSIASLTVRAEGSKMYIVYDVKLMEEPSLTSNIIGTLVKGQTVTAEAVDENFYVTTVDGVTGYVPAAAINEDMIESSQKEPGAEYDVYCEYDKVFPIYNQYASLTKEEAMNSYQYWLTALNESSRIVRVNDGTIILPKFIFQIVNETETKNATIILNDDVVLRYSGLEIKEDDDLLDTIDLSVDLSEDTISFRNKDSIPSDLKIELGFKEPTKLVQNSVKLETEEEPYGNYYFVALENYSDLTYMETAKESDSKDDVSTENTENKSNAKDIALIVIGIILLISSLTYLTITERKKRGVQEQAD